MRSALKFLTGSMMTYVLMAACADRPRPHSRVAMNVGGSDAQANGGGSTAVESDAMASGGSRNEASVGGSESIVDAAVDAILEPVSDAAAEPATDGTRLKAVYLVGDDGAKQWNYVWWDSKLNTECTFIPFADGSTRCVPSTAAYSGFFSDAGCTAQLFIAVGGTCSSAQSATYGVGKVTVSCGAAVYPAAYRLARVDPPKVYSGTPGSCSDITSSAKPNPPAYTFYTGVEVPLSDFVAATKQHG